MKGRRIGRKYRQPHFPAMFIKQLSHPFLRHSQGRTFLPFLPPFVPSPLSGSFLLLLPSFFPFLISLSCLLIVFLFPLSLVYRSFACFCFPFPPFSLSHTLVFRILAFNAIIQSTDAPQCGGCRCWDRNEVCPSSSAKRLSVDIPPSPAESAAPSRSVRTKLETDPTSKKRGDDEMK